eukprot:TRINITY_DN11923_c0_g3_i1.p2 TRINITY_DN11923_c0_g3~~TRINITY_DN11923_c0_g3_i1.p2  ORF type:complete len:191 (-),score=50.67 TRINITY_DN11923_c0_g3_i1:99-671(-)
MKSKYVRALITVTNGSDEIETVIVADVLRRADILVTIAKVTSIPNESPTLEWKGSQGTTFLADARFEDIIDKVWDVIILPGGQVSSLAESKIFMDRIKWQKADSRYLTGIGEAPALVLVKNRLLEDEKATAAPGAASEGDGQVWEESPMVVSGKMVTARSQGTSFMFAFKIMEILMGKKKVDEVKKGLII